jgi:hypothetical protein
MDGLYQLGHPGVHGHQQDELRLHLYGFGENIFKG